MFGFGGWGIVHKDLGVGGRDMAVEMGETVVGRGGRGLRLGEVGGGGIKAELAGTLWLWGVGSSGGGVGEDKADAVALWLVGRVEGRWRGRDEEEDEDGARARRKTRTAASRVPQTCDPSCLIFVL